METTIQIVDLGRGLQLSTSRITVQDLVPYFQEGLSPEEIIRWIPTLTLEEIAVVEEYYQSHQEELDLEDRRIREQGARGDLAPAMEEILRRGGEKMASLREVFAKNKRQAERNGNHPSR